MKVVKAPNEVLRAKTKPVKKVGPSLLTTLKQMVKLTRSFHDPEGVGLASTQIGLKERFFVAKNGQKFQAFINPKIFFWGKRTKKYFEGCLSIPNYWGQVQRATQIKVSYMDETGQIVTKTLKGIPAWIFQHEMDHLEGKLFPDRVLEQGGRFFKFTGKDPKTNEDIFEEVTL
ncbi:MAG: peptide deformylase [Candidatus Daviesbacteria bacterium]|nr:MAG: peptide deformylase [Candidatus Daviesbacteria bacterium]